MQRRKGRPVALGHEGSSGKSRGVGDALRSDGRVDGERLLRRLEAALNGPSRQGLMMLERPLVGGGEGVKTRSPLCRTEPLGAGVAPLHAGPAQCGTGG